MYVAHLHVEYFCATGGVEGVAEHHHFHAVDAMIVHVVHLILCGEVVILPCRLSF